MQNSLIDMTWNQTECGELFSNCLQNASLRSISIRCKCWFIWHNIRLSSFLHCNTLKCVFDLHLILCSPSSSSRTSTRV